MNFLRIRELIRKEFIQLFRDKRNRPLLIVAPFIQLVLFGYVVSTDVRYVRVAWLDQSKSPESRMLSDAFDSNPTFEIIRHFEYPKDWEEFMLRRNAEIAVRIPPDFSQKIRRHQSAAVQIMADGSMSNMTFSCVSYTATVLEMLNTRLINELYSQKMSYGRIDARIRTWYNPNLESQNFYVPGIVAFLIMLLTLLLTSMAIIREKESGTMEQLIVTPLTPAELILGKTVPFIIIAQIQMVMVTLFAMFWFEIPLIGSVPLLFAATCLFLLSTLGIGLFISTVSSTQQQAMMTTFFFIMPFFLLSGFVFPIANMPPIAQALTYLNPLRYFLVIIRGIFLKGVGFDALWQQFAGLAVLGVLVFIGALTLFRKRLD